jgi:predicted MPP superfamily phosphohydrolase
MTEQAKPPFRQNMRRFLTIVGTLLGVVLGAHYYFWARLVRDTALPHPWDILATAALALAALSFPAMVYARLQRPGLFRWISPLTFLWMGWALVLLLSLGAGDLLQGLWHLGHPGPALPASHRAQGALAVATLSLGAWALSQARPRVLRRDISLAKLPVSFAGFRLVQISDLHVGGRVDLAYVQDVVDQVNDLQPDLIVITGDLLDGDLEAVRGALQPLKALEARHGVYYVTGNHEYFHGIQAWLEEVPRLGLRLLMNERVRISNGLDAFDLAGVDDFMGRAVPGHGPDFERALAGREAGIECILLAHQPKAFPAAKQHGVGLLLAGHTHAGQMWPFMHLVKLDQPYVAGHYQEDDTQLYVNQGTGYWGPPMRLGTRSEITLLTLMPDGPASA